MVVGEVQMLLVPIVTGVATFATTFWVTLAKNRAELRKLKSELLNAYSRDLFAKRLDSYPQLYSILSDYMKVLDYGDHEEENLSKFYGKIENIDSQVSLLLSRDTTNLLYLFRLYLISVLVKKDRDIDWQVVRSSIQQLDRTLRAELGTFVFGVPEAERTETLEHIDRLLELTGRRQA